MLKRKSLYIKLRVDKQEQKLCYQTILAILFFFSSFVVILVYDAVAVYVNCLVVYWTNNFEAQMAVPIVFMVVIPLCIQVCACVYISHIYKGYRKNICRSIMPKLWGNRNRSAIGD